jgi:hypothetical protein
MVVSALAAAPRARGATTATEEMEGWMRMMALSNGVSGGSERGDASLGQRQQAMLRLKARALFAF